MFIQIVPTQKHSKIIYCMCSLDICLYLSYLFRFHFSLLTSLHSHRIQPADMGLSVKGGTSCVTQESYQVGHCSLLSVMPGRSSCWFFLLFCSFHVRLCLSVKGSTSRVTQESCQVGHYSLLSVMTEYSWAVTPGRSSCWIFLWVLGDFGRPACLLVSFWLCMSLSICSSHF